FDEDRERINAALLEMLRSPEGPVRLTETARIGAVRGNHDTRSAVDAWFGGRWAVRRLGLREEGKHWMELADHTLEPQARSAKSLEDSWGHQWSATMMNIASWAMASGRLDYFKSEPLRLAAERALI